MALALISTKFKGGLHAEIVTAGLGVEYRLKRDAGCLHPAIRLSNR